MRVLGRNKRLLYYALRTGETANVDEYGNLTGEVTPTYSAPVKFYGNVSAAAGEDMVQAFGSFTAYTRTLCVSDNACPIDENSIVWFGADPVAEPHNYVVVRKADSKNGILYALQEVTVS